MKISAQKSHKKRDSDYSDWTSRILYRSFFWAEKVRSQTPQTITNIGSGGQSPRQGGERRREGEREKKSNIWAELRTGYYQVLNRAATDGERYGTKHRAWGWRGQKVSIPRTTRDKPQKQRQRYEPQSDAALWRLECQVIHFLSALTRSKVTGITLLDGDQPANWQLDPGTISCQVSLLRSVTWHEENKIKVSKSTRLKICRKKLLTCCMCVLRCRTFTRAARMLLDRLLCFCYDVFIFGKSIWCRPHTKVKRRPLWRTAR